MSKHLSNIRAMENSPEKLDLEESLKQLDKAKRVRRLLEDVEDKKANIEKKERELSDHERKKEEAQKRKGIEAEIESDKAKIQVRSIYLTVVPIRPRRRGERHSLRTFPGVSLRPHLAFNSRPRRLSTPPDAFQLHPDARFVCIGN